MTLNRILVKNMSKQVVIMVLFVSLINLSLPLVEANGNSSMDLLTDFTPWSNLLEEATLGLVLLNFRKNKPLTKDRKKHCDET